MAAYGENIPHTIPASTDMSTFQFRLVAIDNNGRGTLSGSGTAAIGIQQNKPSALGQALRYIDVGESKLVAGNAWNEGDFIQSNAQGFGTTAAGVGDRIVAQAMMAVGGSGDIGLVRLVSFKN